MQLQLIGEVSKRLNISTRTLRYYEQIGLIRPGKNEDSAYRVYDEETIERIRRIIMLRKLRIPLKSIADILRSADMAMAVEVFERSLHELDEEITALTTIRGVINAFLDRLQIGSVKLQLLDDESLLEIVDSLTIPKNNIKEEKTMGELEQANEQLGKLTDKDVRIVYLPPSAVAAYQYEGDEPEGHVGKVIHQFVKTSNLAKIKPDLRHYGFNAPNPVDETNAHGYEMWVTIPDDMDVPAPLVKKHFEGGLYAAHMIPFGAFEEWGWLWEWVEKSKKYEMNNEGKGGECMHGLLEESLNYYNNLQLENDEPDDLQLDLLIPIRLRK